MKRIDDSTGMDMFSQIEDLHLHINVLITEMMKKVVNNPTQIHSI